MNWYSLRVISGKEEKIKSSIFRELEYVPEIAKGIEEILIPTENVVDIKNGKKQVKKKVFFLYNHPEWSQFRQWWLGVYRKLVRCR